MNTQLVETLAQIISALTPEEKELLQEKTTQPPWKEEYQKLVAIREKIFERREGKPLEINVDEIIYQMREERTEELIDACFPTLSQKASQITE